MVSITCGLTSQVWDQLWTSRVNSPKSRKHCRRGRKISVKIRELTRTQNLAIRTFLVSTNNVKINMFYFYLLSTWQSPIFMFLISPNFSISSVIRWHPRLLGLSDNSLWNHALHPPQPSIFRKRKCSQKATDDESLKWAANYETYKT